LPLIMTGRFFCFVFLKNSFLVPKIKINFVHFSPEYAISTNVITEVDCINKKNALAYLTCTMRSAIGMKEMRIVWMRKIHFPLIEVGLNLQSPLEIS